MATTHERLVLQGEQAEEKAEGSKLKKKTDFQHGDLCKYKGFNSTTLFIFDKALPDPKFIHAVDGSNEEYLRTGRFPQKMYHIDAVFKVDASDEKMYKELVKQSYFSDYERDTEKG